MLGRDWTTEPFSDACIPFGNLCAMLILTPFPPPVIVLMDWQNCRENITLNPRYCSMGAGHPDGLQLHLAEHQGDKPNAAQRAGGRAVTVTVCHNVEHRRRASLDNLIHLRKWNVR